MSAEENSFEDLKSLVQRLSKSGWTPGRKDIAPLMEHWLSLNESQQERALSALGAVDASVVHRFKNAWQSSEPRIKGALARSLAKAILRKADASEVQWLSHQCGLDADTRVRKGFAQAIGASLQSGSCPSREVLVEGLLVASQNPNLEKPEAKALMEALSKSMSRSPKVAEAMMVLGQSVAFGVKLKSELILKRDLARDSNEERLWFEFEHHARLRGFVFWFIPGMLRLALRQSIFAGFDRLGDEALFTSETKSLCARSDKVLDNRLWLSTGVCLGSMDAGNASYEALDVAKVVIQAADVLRSMTKGLSQDRPMRIRYGRQESQGRSQVWDFAKALDEANVGLLSDGRSAHWDITVSKADRELLVVAKPLFDWDRRWSYRDGLPVADGASQGTIAAALASLAEIKPGNSVWDPFCGAGTELMEAALICGGSCTLYGTDISEDILRLGQDIASKSSYCSQITLQYLDALKVTQEFDVILTNPPFGMRTSRGEARGLLEVFFSQARARLKPAGRLVLLSHAPSATADWAYASGLRMVESLPIRLGGMQCELQRFDRP